jgi:hypothetical protein
MKTGLGTLPRPRYRRMPFAKASDYSSRLPRDERDRFWRDQDAPRNVRRRRRDARRWLNLLLALSTNPCRSERQPGDGWLTNEEKFAIWRNARQRLRHWDPELYRAVERIEWEDRARYEDITNLDERVAQWRIVCARQWPQQHRLRAETRQFGAYPLSHEQIWAILGVPSREVFLTTAEVAERQTR